MTPTAAPRAHLLSNGSYSVMITDAGTGYSHWGDLAITRWRADPTCDGDGTFIFLRDVATGDVWSVGAQPSGPSHDDYEVTFSEDRADIVRRHASITSRLEVIVAPDDDVELRRVTLSNTGSRPREIELTSYAEIVLAPAAVDAAHPAFSRLLVCTECLPERSTLLAARRPKSPDESWPWMGHAMHVNGETIGELEWETDRARFIGRGRTIRTAVSVRDHQGLSGTVGSVLDPVASLRRRVRIPPGGHVDVTCATLVAPSRDAALALAARYSDAAAFERTAEQARSRASDSLRALDLADDDARLFQRLAGALLYPDRVLRAPADVLRRQSGGQAVLWSRGISGDRPIVLVVNDGDAKAAVVRLLVRAHDYWHAKGLVVDLVILTDAATYEAQSLDDLRASLAGAVAPPAGTARVMPKGDTLFLHTEEVSAQQRDVLAAAARIVLFGRETVAVQVERTPPVSIEPLRMPSVVPSVPATVTRPEESLPPVALEFPNGLGGFAPDGREYVVTLQAGQRTPAPWINVIANDRFGCLVSESGSGYTWSGNSQENQLTEWSNDAVSDPPSEALYVRDDETGEVWGPTALPVREHDGRYVCRHGQGYSRFEYDAHGIALELLQFVPVDDAIKVSRLTLTNHSGRHRRLSVTAYVQWVLGVSRGGTAPYIVTEIDPATQAIFARNAWRRESADRVAFADIGGTQTGCTADRTEFLGRQGTVARPAALESDVPLSGRVGAGLDPCAVLQRTMELPVGAQAEVTILLGEGATGDDAQRLVARYRAEDLDESLRTVMATWDDTLGAVSVTTPDRSMDLLLNRWLLYQVLACRVWARAAFYQASGAYGFRDQLQDVLALIVSRPEIARQHLLRAASRQFIEGDVQHWWHPPAGRGVRTRVSDDLLWLPYAVHEYIQVSGDASVLEESVPFLEGSLLDANVTDAYFEPRPSEQQATVFEHCARAIDRSLGVGRHGLPLMGSGDWNDGMNRVGAGGEGESVWLGWFLHAVLRDWSGRADARGDGARSQAWRSAAVTLEQSIQREAWDGAWYRRAFFDDGSPLGSAVNDACRIDAIAQSWSVISGGTDTTRQHRAMASLEEHLVRHDDRIALLLTPPFDVTPLEPGYIKGYPPGIRENGGQYTHGAVWSVVALALLGEGDKAAGLFSLLNPINHTRSATAVQRYRVEPYVMAGDVYGEPPHAGRGGWSWYTGSAAWMYRAGLQWILGFRLRGTQLIVDPCIPQDWPGFSMVFRYHSARYEITVDNPDRVCRGVTTGTVDGERFDPPIGIPLDDDGTTHRVRVVLGTARALA